MSATYKEKCTPITIIAKIPYCDQNCEAEEIASLELIEKNLATNLHLNILTTKLIYTTMTVEIDK